VTGQAGGRPGQRASQRRAASKLRIIAWPETAGASTARCNGAACGILARGMDRVPPEGPGAGDAAGEPAPAADPSRATLTDDEAPTQGEPRRPEASDAGGTRDAALAATAVGSLPGMPGAGAATAGRHPGREPTAATR